MEIFDTVKLMYEYLFAFIGRVLAIFGITEEDIKNAFKKDEE